MTLRTAVIALSVAATPLAHAEPAAVNAFARALLLGIQLSAKHAELRGEIGQAQTACIQALTPSAFYQAVEAVMTEAMTSLERAGADQFFSTPVGEKFVKYELLKFYPTVGETAPEPLPDFSDIDYRELERFAATSAGQKLVARQIMQSVSAKRSYETRMGELMKQCGAK